MTRSSAVPGGTVERMMIVWGTALLRRARPIRADTWSTASIETLPLGALGVPTEMNVTSDPAIAAAASSVARSRPSRTPAAIRPSISASTMGD